MRVFEDLDALRAACRALEREGVRIGFVPTMGALHEGHLSLIAKARAEGAEHVVASIFVNPLQFDRPDDLDAYPRDRAGDLAQLEAAGCDAVFFPSADAMYPPGHQTRVEVPRASQGLCGAHRPGHFVGVATVVLQLLNLVRPTLAVFGEKDFQQLTLIRTMARDLHLDARIVGAPLVREPDGLALSSRNRRLSPADRSAALAIARGLLEAERRYRAGERAGAALLDAARAPMAAEPALTLEYLELRAFADLEPLDTADRPSLILAAAHVGPVRLVDNVILDRPPG